jgi:hypothetical protein
LNLSDPVINFFLRLFGGKPILDGPFPDVPLEIDFAWIASFNYLFFGF